LYASQLTTQCICLAMKLLTYATENIFMSLAHTAACTSCYTCSSTWKLPRTLSGISLMSLVKESDGEASGPWSKECRLSKRPGHLPHS
jgi:hypothetical protein